ncbi:hypothetical protein MNBD_PLANCTO02-992 [hydrothermal vent metagenome]|uniref:Glutaredoxin domain-containing protein n=1 Tax=hydrothermal vent metagenome TaxID=652676 RepID=A0A3B1E5Z6_9ZZZZ
MNRHETESSPFLINIGTPLLLLGISIFAIAFLEKGNALPFELPRAWYDHRFLWLGMGLFSFLYGCLKLQGQKPKDKNWEPSHGGNPFDRLILYTREECHLCSQAKDILWEYYDFLPDIEEIDIDEDIFLKEKFDQCVPVIEIDGKIRFRGQINEVLLRRLIENGLTER